MKNIVGFVGSPRSGGNTETLVRAILAGAAEAGAKVKRFNLAAMKINGCASCYTCQKTGRCVQADDMQELYDRIYAADGIVIGSPVYMGHMSGQTKVFFDRLFALMKPDMTSRLPRKLPLVLAFAQGDPNLKSYAPAFKITADMFDYLGFKVLDTLVAGGLEDKRSVRKQTRVLANARKAGKRLAR
jgi:multimeric flavodoxin WrbA